MQKADAWADSVFNALTLEEQVGQLIFIRANQSGKPYDTSVSRLIKLYNLGGVVFFAGDPVEQALQTNAWNKLPRVPLFISIDAEWGLGMRLANTLHYPMQMTLGATANEPAIYKMGEQIGRQCRRMGIHINFAPVVDVNNNPANPVIGMRSFGENPQKVGQLASAYINGMQDQNIIACAKHFPGHGDVQSDSHYTLPLLDKNKKELRNTEFIPFEMAIENGVDAVMTAHLATPAFESDSKRPASLSRSLVTRQLKNKMHFGGLVITDALDMKGVTKYFPSDQVALEAFLAGNDILLIPEDIPASVKAIIDAVKNGKISHERLEESCRKILRYKYLTGAYNRVEIDTTNLVADLNQRAYHRTAEKLFDKSITIVKNNDEIIPVSYPDTLNPAILIMGTEEPTPFDSLLGNFFGVQVWRLGHDVEISRRQEVLDRISANDLVIIGVVNTNISAGRRFGISESDIQFIEQIARSKTVILDLFASPYSLGLFSSTSAFGGMIISYQDTPYVQELSAQLILGMKGAGGRLPVSAGGFAANTGFESLKSRLTYADPVDLSIDTALLAKVDSIALDGIRQKAYPGCQIIAAIDGYIFYDKTFGYHTYDSVNKVQHDDIYDLASLTKILATTPALMKLVDEGRLNIDGKLSDYLPYLKGTNKESLGFREVLTHQAGLFPWIPYYEGTLFDNKWDTTVYRSVISEEFPVRVAANMYISENYSYNIYQQIIDSPVGKKEYAYSDLGFYFFKQMIEDITNRAFEEYVEEEFYLPLGLKNLMYRPLRKVDKNRIAPTENDRVFRHQLLVGDVHDQGAAMLGGVSGHAGVFGNAYDVTVMLQLFLNGGSYGGRKFVSEKVLSEFTSVQFPEQDNRRGLGFDKPMLEFEEHKGNCRDASPESFGHSGFTGTYAWADPENGLVYVFISNRVYPDMDNPKIMDLDIRTNIHQLFYESVKSVHHIPKK